MSDKEKDAPPDGASNGTERVPPEQPTTSATTSTTVNPPPENATDDSRIVVEVKDSPAPVAATPQQNGLAPNTGFRPLYPGHQPQPQPQPQLQVKPPPHPPLQNIQPRPPPSYLGARAQAPAPAPAPPSLSYVSHGQPPLLMDKCPRCHYVPSLQYGQQPPPLPPYGSYMPPQYLPQPGWVQQTPSCPPPQAPQHQTPQTPGQVQAAKKILQVAPEFRGVPENPEYQIRVPPPKLGQEDVTHYLPEGREGYVGARFIPLPKYAPFPANDALEQLGPKWPSQPKGTPQVDQRPNPEFPESRSERRLRRGYQRMTRDKRRDVLLMRRLGYQFESIARFLGTTVSACHYTCRKGNPETGHHLAGRRVHMPPQIVPRIIDYAKDYQEKQRAAGKNKKTGKLIVPMLTYNMIRENVLADANGEVPKELKFTDEALKSLLNKHDIWLRAPMPEHRKKMMHAHGKKQWHDKLAKDRAEAAKKVAEAAAAAGQPVSAELAAMASGADVAEEHDSDTEDDDDEDEDEVMGEGYGEQHVDDDDDDDDSENEGEEVEGHDHGRGQQPMRIEDQLMRAIGARENYR